MERVKFTRYQGVRLLILDFSNCSSAEVLELLKEAKRVIRAEQEHSVLLITLINHTHFNREVSKELRAYVQGNAPYVKASAVVGVAGLQEIIINAVTEGAGRPIAVFEDLEKAKEWLVSFETVGARRF